MTGHVFVIQGDTRRFACDAYMHATDRDLRPNGGWTRSAPDATNRIDPDERADFHREKRFTLTLKDRHDVPNEPATILTAVPYHGVRHESEFVPRIEAFFAAAVEVGKRRRVTATVAKRARLLFAVPLFGTGGGGASDIRGRVFRMIYKECWRAAAEYDVDVAIVLRDSRDYALAQVIRRELGGAWPELREKEQQAQKLGDLARQARLVPFMGAGISLSAGAPTWNGLIEKLAEAAGIYDPDIIESLKSHDALDQAAYLRQEFEHTGRGTRPDKTAFAEAVIEAVDVRRYGIAPPLLAALDAEQAITLNYDELFEWAALDGERPRRVIPGEATDEHRWLLKLHGTVTDPASIVLTRDDYLGFDSDRSALSSLVKATLMTRHLLFVGFSVKDPHFHEIVHDVRRALPEGRNRFGTVLTIDDDPVKTRLWKQNLEFIRFGDGRQLEIFLDAALAYGASSHSYLLARGYGSALDPDVRTIAHALQKMADSIPESARSGAVWNVVSGMLGELGWQTESSRSSWRALPKGLK